MTSISNFEGVALIFIFLANILYLLHARKNPLNTNTSVGYMLNGYLVCMMVHHILLGAK